MIAVPHAKEPTEAHDGVFAFAGRLVDHHIIDAAELLPGGVVNAGSVDLAGCDELAARVGCTLPTPTCGRIAAGGIPKLSKLRAAARCVCLCFVDRHDMLCRTILPTHGRPRAPRRNKR
jgi:hypothetical protein